MQGVNKGPAMDGLISGGRFASGNRSAAHSFDGAKGAGCEYRAFNIRTPHGQQGTRYCGAAAMTDQYGPLNGVPLSNRVERRVHGQIFPRLTSSVMVARRSVSAGPGNEDDRDARPPGLTCSNGFAGAAGIVADLCGR